MWGAPLLVPRLRPELDRAFLWTILSEGSDVRIVSRVPLAGAVKKSPDKVTATASKKWRSLLFWCARRAHILTGESLESAWQWEG